MNRPINKKAISLASLFTILVGIFGLVFYSSPERIETRRERRDITQIELALKMYKMHHSTYPTESEGLNALESKYNGEKYLESVPLDPWNRKYIYRNPGGNGEIDVLTLGQDGVPGGVGENQDVGNWMF